MSSIASKIIDRYTEFNQRLHANGKAIDCDFIRRGYVSLLGQIEHHKELSGPRGYDLYIGSQKDEESFSRRRDLIRSIMIYLVKKETEGAISEADWDCVMGRLDLDGSSKVMILGRFFPSRTWELLRSQQPALDVALKDEQSRICSIWKETEVSLLEDDSVELRKEVCNTVMADAFGALGFRRHRRHRRLDSFYKSLTERLGIVTRLDAVSIETSSPSPSRSLYSSRLPIDGLTFLQFSQSKGVNKNILTFLPIQNCLASSLIFSYKDTRSLEVALRASAMWYEISVAPFEAVIKELD